LTTAPGGPWAVERHSGRAAALLDGSLQVTAPGDEAIRRVRVLTVDRPAVVLGSSQPRSDLDLPATVASGIDVVRRRSGGGAVLVGPGALLWVDLMLPAGDPLWDADVGRAAWWAGAAWAAALEAVGAGPADVWHGPMQASPWSRLVCFAGLAPGEVTVRGQKVVGISQRRTRQGALFQTAALLRWEPAALMGLLRLDEGERARGQVDLEVRAAGVGEGRGPALIDALVAALPGVGI
jgi:lipoate---protein ligase